MISSGTSGNLPVWLKENKIDVNALADSYTMSSWKTPIKQTELRAQLAAETAYSKPSTNLTSNVGQVFTNISLPAIARAQPRGAGRINENPEPSVLMPEPQPMLNETQQIEKVEPPNMQPAAMNQNPVASVLMPEPQPVAEIFMPRNQNRLEDYRKKVEKNDRNDKLVLIGGIAIAALVGFFIIRRMKK